jgi:arginine transport system permease protein
MMSLLSYLPDLASGLVITLILMLSSVAMGLLLAVLMTMASRSDIYLLRKIIDVFLFFIRGTPLLVQLYLIYYGASQFAWIRESSLWIILRDPMACAIIALSVNSACYTTILFQGAINSVPKNEIDACEAIGMSKWLAFRRIIFPRAFRIALPAYSNEVIMILKSTSLASTITLLDLMGITQQLIAQTYQTAELYILVGIIYLILNGVITSLFSMFLKWNAIPHTMTN